MNTIAKLFLLLGMMIGASVAHGIGNELNSKTMEKTFDPAESINQLAIDLYKQTAQQEGNLFLSPYSISTALAMVYGAARGETAEQMNNTLHFGGPSATHPAFSNLRKQLNAIQKKGDVELDVANSLWLQKGYTILPDYLSMTKEFYDAQIENVPFKSDPEAARLRINSWVAEKTADKITDLLAEGTFNIQTHLVLANAIYFKGNWASQFKKTVTRERPFTIRPGTNVNIPMMAQKGYFNLARTEAFHALELPYEGAALSMVVLLPTKKNALAGVEKSLTPQLLANLKFYDEEVIVQLPKFKFEKKLELNKMLANMGMPLAFSMQADLSGMDGSKELYIGTVVHQAFIEVNEKGTEAVAYTVALSDSFGGPPKPIRFTADHPFLFLIRENSTGTILFIGRVTDPTK